MTKAAQAFKDQHLSAADAFRCFPGAPMMLIGQASVTLLERGEAVTVDAIRYLLSVLTEKEDAELLRRTLERLDCLTDARGRGLPPKSPPPKPITR